ncbi:hypothetical protein BDV96DRAFT_651642 [Lophiotrema nucula]|uniref:BHLH domain-containing protein n=1 Tax=Lophiotrema nucula TaxID=690887 RepID=A0A6A5YSF2_9PLEO|nr:hypothetical protein BDV96DRAFT_651642 [Lophiotrema nucula]
MNDAGASSWSGAEQFDPMGAVADHDLGSLIDFDGLDLDFSIDYTNGSHDHHHDANQQLTDLAESLDVQHLQNHFNAPVSQEHHDGVSSMQSNTAAGNSISQAGNSFFDFTMQGYGQTNPAFSTAQDQIYRPHSGVPPTPNSIEMHGDPGRYMQQMDAQQLMFEQRFGGRKDDSFTPLVSPAVTPHETRFQLQEFTTVPGAYFSPLTSPALNAQNHQHIHSQASHYTTSGSSAGTSPVDVDMELLGEAAIAQPEQGTRRLRSTRRTMPRSSNATERVRQSPIVKPGRRKATVSSLIPPKEVSELVEEAQKSARSSRPSSSGLAVPRSRDTSETESISPEPLLEMGPPPKPRSVTQSPAMLAQAKSGQGVAPATPASLMRIQQSPTFSPHSEAPPMLDDLTLPEASLDRPSLSRSDTVILDDGQITPRMGARKTPKLGPSSTPSAEAALSGKPSPMLSAVASPTSPGFALGRKGDPKANRNLKKRGSTSSTLVSPALRPKISPSIKPLLPDNSVTDETHALLLASKSNYQNILDGTTVPGVVYPTSLSTNLTSKRTSHKIAEQGRRNRINTALQEMQALLPSPKGGPKPVGSPEPMTAAQSNNSKAAKVESAIDYIKQLQEQCNEKDKLLDQKDQEVDALRKELAALRRGSSVSSSTNAAENDTSMKAESSSSSEESADAT